MRETIVNTANKGLVTDISPEQDNNSSLVDARNIDLITTSDENLVIQKREGSSVYVIDGNEIKLKDGYIPLEVKKYNNVLYIISADANNNVELGTFPSPDWENILPKDSQTVIGAGTPKVIDYYSSEAASTYSFQLYPTEMSPSGYKARILNYTKVTITNNGSSAASYTITRSGESRWLLLTATKDIVSGNIATSYINPGDEYIFYIMPDARFNSTESFGTATITVTDSITNKDLTIQSTSINGDNIASPENKIENVTISGDTLLRFDVTILDSPSKFTFNGTSPTTYEVLAYCPDDDGENDLRLHMFSETSEYPKNYIAVGIIDTSSSVYKTGVGVYYNYGPVPCEVDLQNSKFDVQQSFVDISIETSGGEQIGVVHLRSVLYQEDTLTHKYTITHAEIMP